MTLENEKNRAVCIYPKFCAEDDGELHFLIRSTQVAPRRWVHRFSLNFSKCMLVYGYILLSLHLLARYKQYDRRHVFSRFLLDKKIPKFLKILKRRERAPTRRTIFLEKKSWKESTARFTSECAGRSALGHARYDVEDLSLVPSHYHHHRKQISKNDPSIFLGNSLFQYHQVKGVELNRCDLKPNVGQ